MFIVYGEELLAPEEETTATAYLSGAAATRKFIIRAIPINFRIEDDNRRAGRSRKRKPYKKGVN